MDWIDRTEFPFQSHWFDTPVGRMHYVDEGDGDHDLIAGIGDGSDYGWDHGYDNHGRWLNGRLHGYVYLIGNDGTDD